MVVQCKNRLVQNQIFGLCKLDMRRRVRILCMCADCITEQTTHLQNVRNLYKGGMVDRYLKQLDVASYTPFAVTSNIIFSC